MRVGWRFNPALTMQHAWGGLEAGRGEHLGTPPVPGRAADVWTNSELCAPLAGACSPRHGVTEPSDADERLDRCVRRWRAPPTKKMYTKKLRRGKRRKNDVDISYFVPYPNRSDRTAAEIPDRLHRAAGGGPVPVAVPVALMNVGKTRR